MTVNHLVVAGASLAGLRAVEAARKTGFEGRITVVGAEPHPPYDRPPLSKQYLDSGTTPSLRTTEELSALRVEWLMGTPATALNTRARTITLGERQLDFDALIIATGATPRTLPNPRELRGVHTLRTLEDAQAIRAALDAGARTVVIGAGFIGAEVASAARARGLAVTIVEASLTPLARAVGQQLGNACAALHQRNGADLRCGATVVEMLGGKQVEAVLLSDGTIVRADLVVIGVGAEPATHWLQRSGLLLNDGIICDEFLFTGHPGIYAAGDVARWRNPLFERHMRLEHWSSAAEQGAAAARNALNPGAAKPYQTVPYFWSDSYGQRIQFAGIPATDEVLVVEGKPFTGSRWVALYREGDRLAGVLTMNGQAVIMKYRNLIAARASWVDGLRFAESRHAAGAVRA